ncbi:MAG: 1-acyl-sn-glycerol-3-phosphate acyltransferase [Treponema sp.]|jgi:glycerol-3-phosphate O-acyltransferase|nr:1-acyl-sn-glycerol-3-phosphate acyltransferase [Treponema sp.]
METLNTAFREFIREAMSLSKVETVITEKNVYQQGDDAILPFLDKMVEALAEPGSGVDGMEHLEELLALAESGKSCLLLLEHYSNMDLSIFSWCVRKAGGRGANIARNTVAIAGMKLNEDNPAVAALASAYSRIVIYPSRSLQDLDAEKDRDEIIRSNGINRAAMKALNDIKVKGKLILVFPSGTRYRPWDPSTKKGVREIDSYIRSFDYMCCVAINGQILHIQDANMMNDTVSRDLVLVTAGPVLSCAEFRGKALAADPAADRKQAAVDAIMAELERIHNKAEEKRLKQKPGDPALKRDAPADKTSG